MRSLFRLLALVLPLVFAAGAQAQQQCQQSVMPRFVPGTTYTVQSTDNCWWVMLQNPGSIVVSLPAPGLVFQPSFTTTVLPLANGTVTFTSLPDDAGKKHLINGGATLTLPIGQGAVLKIQQDANWYVLPTGGSAGANGLPTRWNLPNASPYLSGVNDNATWFSPATLGAPLAVDLPATSSIGPGWTIGLTGGAYGETVNVNGVSGGSITAPDGTTGNSYTLPTNINAAVQYDGSSFRVLPFGFVQNTLAYPGLNTSQDQSYIRSGGFTFSQEWGGQVGLNFNFTNGLAVGIVTPAGAVTHSCAGECFDAAIAGYANGLNADRFAIGMYAEGNAEVTGGYALGINSETSNCQLHVACGSGLGVNVSQIQAAEFDTNVISTGGASNLAPTGVFFGELLDLEVIGPQPTTLTALEISTIGGYWNAGVDCFLGSVSTGSCLNVQAVSAADNSQSAFVTFHSINGLGTDVTSWIAATANNDFDFNNTVNGANFLITHNAVYPQFEMNFADAGGNGGLLVGNTSGAANSIAQVVVQTAAPSFDGLIAASQATNQFVIESDTGMTNGAVIKSLAGPVTLTGHSGALVISSLPSSAGSGGLYACVDNTGTVYRKSSCP